MKAENNRLFRGHHNLKRRNGYNGKDKKIDHIRCETQIMRMGKEGLVELIKNKE